MLRRMCSSIPEYILSVNRNLSTKPMPRGTTKETAFVVSETNHFKALHSEYRLLYSKYPGYIRETQYLLKCDGKYYDRIDIRTLDGRKLSIYFDISLAAAESEKNEPNILSEQFC